MSTQLDTDPTQEFQLPKAISSAKNLPSLPSVAMNVLEVTNDPEGDISQLTAAISADPALATKILKLANSAKYRRGREIQNLNQASGVLGMKAVSLMALSFSLTTALPREGMAAFDFGLYWRRSLTSAVGARALARLVKSRYVDEAFLCGLLSRVGQLVMATTIVDQYQAVLDKSEEAIPSRSTEREVLGYDFHQVGEALLNTWHLPKLLTTTVGKWNVDVDNLEGADEGVSDVISLMQVADHISVLICESDKAEALRTVCELGEHHFGLSQEEMESFIVSLQEEVMETATSMQMADDLDDTEYASILDEAREQLIQISLGAMDELEQSQTQMEELTEANRVLDGAAKTDRLTTLPNRAHFDERLEHVVEARLKGHSANALGILIIDIDHFKSFNDTHGHVIGDLVLNSVACRLKGATRDTDFIARYGGEEFVAILPNTTLPDLESVAERLRQTIETSVVETEGKTLNVTISLGGACVNMVTTHDDGMALVELADKCLYEAKEAGRNQWSCRVVELGK